MVRFLSRFSCLVGRHTHKSVDGYCFICHHQIDFGKIWVDRRHYVKIPKPLDMIIGKSNINTMPKPYRDTKMMAKVMRYRGMGLSFNEISRLLAKDVKTVFRWYTYGTRGISVDPKKLSTKEDLTSLPEELL